MKGELFGLLARTLIKDLPAIKEQTLLEFTSDQLIKDTFEALSRKGVLSAPVYDEKKKKYIGMIDLRDFVGFVLSLHLKGGPIVWSVDKIVDYSGVNPFVKTTSSRSVLDFIQMLNKRGLHRMAIVDPDSERVIAIASQSSVISWLADNLETALGDVASKTVKEFELQLSGVEGDVEQIQYVADNESVQKAFKLIDQMNIHGVPIVDGQMRLMGSISVSDLKYILQYDLDSLNASTKEFIALVEPSRPPPVSCTLDMTVGDLFKLFASTKVHRVYIVDNQNKLLDVVTMTSLVKSLDKL